MLPPQRSLENSIAEAVEVKHFCIGVMDATFEENLFMVFYEYKPQTPEQLSPKMWCRILFCFAPVSAE